MRKYPLYIIIISLVTVILIAITWRFWPNKTKVINLGQAAIQVEIADNSLERYQGLSGRTKLCGECGMLFVFDHSTADTFSMRGMNFPLDFIWIEDNIVADINPMIYPAQKSSEVLINGPKSNYVLEVNGGFAKSHNISVGDQLNF